MRSLSEVSFCRCREHMESAGGPVFPHDGNTPAQGAGPGGFGPKGGLVGRPAPLGRSTCLSGLPQSGQLLAKGARTPCAIPVVPARPYPAPWLRLLLKKLLAVSLSWAPSWPDLVPWGGACPAPRLFRQLPPTPCASENVPPRVVAGGLLAGCRSCWFMSSRHCWGGLRGGELSRPAC